MFLFTHTFFRKPVEVRSLDWFLRMMTQTTWNQAILRLWS